MGTETKFHVLIPPLVFNNFVKLNNPLMGTETLTLHFALAL